MFKSYLGLAVVLALVGCGAENNDKSSEVIPVTPQAVSVDLSAAKVGQPPAVPVPPQVGAPAVAALEPQAPQAPTDTAKLEAILKAYKTEFNLVPNSFAQLVARGYLPEEPKAPAGMKYVIEPESLKVSIVNQ
jgi:hypothetical protein